MNSSELYGVLAEYQQRAAATLPPEIWHYLEHGAGAGHSLRANLQAFAQTPLLPRVLAQVGGGGTALNLCGQRLAHPLLLAPIAYQALFHPEAESASAQAAQAQDALMIVSSLASRRFQEIAASGVQWWFQLYWQASRQASLALLQRAIDAGCSAVVLTVDAPVKQAQLQLPPHVRAVNLEAAPDPHLMAGQSMVFDGWMRQAPDWQDLAWLRQQCQLPLLLKGVLHPDDAAQAQALGVDGVIVSNHGGRVLDGTPSPLAMLPPIRSRVGPAFPVLLDSGVRSGQDALKAILAGANAVLLGRPYIWALAAQGALGVAHVLRVLRDELEMSMALCGMARLAAPD
ncbi:alpha-hydroxy acid oxidase [Massilia sp. W12]|uniref:alpha-hydroxy acid oxidase n=1 Tax=Massilia sp. W12 TaxID=3126507 RepID=UPI0030CB7366